jgi:hypothetical protein
MSRNSKNYSRLIAARAASTQRKSGGKGPEQTEPKHGKEPSRRHYSTISREAPKARAASSR